jgi:predicted nucleic acid-binding protein
MPDEFLDSNVLVYAFTTDARAPIAQDLLARGCSLNVQILNEFANVARRKLGMSWTQLRDALADIRTFCPAVHSLTIDIHSDALRLAQRHGFSIFDALVVAAALRAGCSTLWSEDMQHGLMVDRRLRLLNPFLESLSRSP